MGGSGFCAREFSSESLSAAILLPRLKLLVLFNMLTMHAICVYGDEMPVPLPAVWPELPAATSNSGSTVDPAGYSMPSEWTLEEAERAALIHNPTLAEAGARIDGARGALLQAGMLPNPTVGYVAGEMGNEGAAGQHGAFISQQFVNRHKLASASARADADVTRLTQEQLAQQQRVLTDVRQSFYELLVLQHRIELTQELSAISSQVVETSRRLVEAGEVRRVDQLQAQVEADRARIELRQVENDYSAAWKRFISVVGLTDLAPQSVRGHIEQLPHDTAWEQLLHDTLAGNPEIAAATSSVELARRDVAVARAQVLPDVNTQFAVQYDDSSGDTIASLQVGVPLPVLNRYQGDVIQARAREVEAQRHVETLALHLRHELANVYYRNQSARMRVKGYQTNLIPNAGEALELIRQGYAAGEASFLELLTAQRTYFQTNLDYLTALGELWNSRWRLEGYLLANSLNQGEP